MHVGVHGRGTHDIGMHVGMHDVCILGMHCNRVEHYHLLLEDVVGNSIIKIEADLSDHRHTFA